MRQAIFSAAALIGLGSSVLGNSVTHAQTPAQKLDERRFATIRVVETHGQMENYLKLRALATGLPIPSGPPTKEFLEKLVYRQTSLDTWMQILAFRYTYDEVVRLKSQGLDLVKYETQVGAYENPEHMFATQDGIVIGEIVRTQWDHAVDDGYTTTVVIAVQEWLKGRTRPDTIRVRVRSGVSGGHRIRSSNDFVRVEGYALTYPRGQHLFLVSRPRYPMQAAMQFGKVVPPNSDFYLFTGDYASIVGDSLQHHGPHASPARYPLKTLSKIRRFAEQFPLAAMVRTDNK